MTRGQRNSLMRRLHRWLGLAVSVLVLLVTVTGILLHNPEWLGPEAVVALCVATDPADHSRLLRGTTWGVDESTDGGATWREVPMLAPPSDVSRILFVAGAAADSTRVVVLGRQTAVESVDGGRVWRNLELPAEARAGEVILRDIAVAPDDRLFLMTSAGLFARGAVDGWIAVGPGTPVDVGWAALIHDLHTGQAAGPVGRRVVEWGGWLLVVVTVTGLVLSYRSSRRRRP